MDRVDLRYLSRQNLYIFNDGFFTANDGQEIFLPSFNTTLYRSDDDGLCPCRQHQVLDVPSIQQHIQTNLQTQDPSALVNTQFIAHPLSSFACARLYTEQTPPSNVTVLNFASAKKPGGGFLNGAMAQEESLCYQSNLYDSLQQANDFYQPPKSKMSNTYTHRMIFSQNITIFRDDQKMEFLTQPTQVNVISCAAVNRNICKDVPLGDATMIERMRRILALAALHQTDHLILGAWGCGVFKNDLKFVITHFLKLLLDEFPHTFKTVDFACHDDVKYRKVLSYIERATKNE